MRLLAIPGSMAFSLAVLMATAEAQNNVSFVSSSGSEANSCATEATPCRSLGVAHNATNSGGKIVCLSSGNFQALPISKSITIDCTGHDVHVPSASIQGAGIRVTIRGIKFDGLGFIGTPGINFVNGSSLHLEDCAISNYVVPGAESGIYFRPSGAARLYVTDCEISNNGTANAGGGIVVHPQGSGSAVVTLNRVTLNGNRYGIFAQGLASTSPIIIDVRDSSVSGSTGHGMVAITDTSLAAIVVQRSSSVQNAGTGIRAEGAGALVHIGSSTVRGNAVGLGVSGGGNILSFQNNEIFGNGVDGAPTGVLALK